MTLWMVRAGQHGEGEGDALENNIVGIGWSEIGDLASVSSSDEIRVLLNATFADEKPSTLANWAGQIGAFRLRMSVGDLVALPLKSTPAVAFGRITGEYTYRPNAVDALRHQRPVEWITDGIARDVIDQDLLYSLGAFMTVCQISRNDAEQRILALLATPQAPADEGAIKTSADATPRPNEGPASDLTDATSHPVDLGQIGRDLIRRRLAERFKEHNLARLVGALLRADGFVCQVSPPGPDGGVDVLAGRATWALTARQWPSR